jgi:hypothetical protein
MQQEPGHLAHPIIERPIGGIIGQHQERVGIQQVIDDGSEDIAIAVREITIRDEIEHSAGLAPQWPSRRCLTCSILSGSFSSELSRRYPS